MVIIVVGSSNLPKMGSAFPGMVALPARRNLVDQYKARHISRTVELARQLQLM